MPDLIESMRISAGGLRAQSSRLRIISENLANAQSTGKTAGAEPYRRQVQTFDQELDRNSGVTMVKPGKVIKDKSDFPTRYMPSHPAADAKGYVKMPNVSTTIEMMDMREAQRSYEANLSAIEASKSMITRTLDILR